MYTGDSFLETLRSQGFEAEFVMPDSTIRRCHISGHKPYRKNGWYVQYTDTIGVFGNWVTQEKFIWKSNKPVMEYDRDEWNRIREDQKAEQEKNRAEARRICREKSARIWKDASVASDSHLYLVKKGVRAYGLKVSKTGQLIVQVHDGRILHGLQFISPEGEKLYLPGTNKTGCYHAIGRVDGKILIVEGYATGASAHEATGHAVAIAFDAGNLLHVAKALRSKYPEVELVICADNDQWTDGNPGLTSALGAAKEVKGLVAVPRFNYLAGGDK